MVKSIKGTLKTYLAITHEPRKKRERGEERGWVGGAGDGRLAYDWRPASQHAAKQNRPSGGGDVHVFLEIMGRGISFQVK